MYSFCIGESEKWLCNVNWWGRFNLEITNLFIITLIDGIKHFITTFHPLWVELTQIILQLLNISRFYSLTKTSMKLSIFSNIHVQLTKDSLSKGFHLSWKCNSIASRTHNKKMNFFDVDDKTLKVSSLLAFFLSLCCNLISEHK